MLDKKPPYSELEAQLREALWIIKYQAKELIELKRYLKAFSREMSDDL